MRKQQLMPEDSGEHQLAQARRPAGQKEHHPSLVQRWVDKIKEHFSGRSECIRITSSNITTCLGGTLDAYLWFVKRSFLPDADHDSQGLERTHIFESDNASIINEKCHTMVSTGDSLTLHRVVEGFFSDFKLNGMDSKSRVMEPATVQVENPLCLLIS
jgi:hypothetical protein